MATLTGPLLKTQVLPEHLSDPFRAVRTEVDVIYLMYNEQQTKAT